VKQVGGQLSGRDRIRLDTVIGLAEMFCSGQVPDAKVVGSVALAIHLSPGRFRVPNDIDIVWSAATAVSEDEIPWRIDASADWQLVAPSLPTLLRSGPSATRQYRMERWGDGLIDRITLQDCRLWPDAGAHEMVHCQFNGRVLALAVEPLAWCIVHKLDSLFKPRKPGWVSSRCRDLFDIALLDAERIDPLLPEISSNIRMLPHELDLTREPPAEWAVVWANLGEVSGFTDLDLGAAWDAALGIAARAGAGVKS